MFPLMTRDGKFAIEVPDWFSQTYNRLNTTPLKYSLMHKSQISKKGKAKNDFPGCYYQDSSPLMDFDVYFGNDGVKIGKLRLRKPKEYKRKVETFCNKNCVNYLNDLGRPDLATKINPLTANECHDFFSSTAGIRNVRKVSRLMNHDIVSALIKKGLVLGIQKIDNGIGHMAPVTGIIDDRFWYANFGDVNRDGHVDEWEAFVAPSNLIDLFYIGRMDESFE